MQHTSQHFGGGQAENLIRGQTPPRQQPGAIEAASGAARETKCVTMPVVCSSQQTFIMKSNMNVPSPETARRVGALVDEQLAVLDRQPIVVDKRADVNGGASANENKVIFVAVAVGEVGTKNGTRTRL